MITKLKQLDVKQKTGYRNITGNPVVLLDERGKIFYDTSELQNRVWEFNLPIGKYYVMLGKIKELPEPLNGGTHDDYKLKDLPKPTRRMDADPETFELIFAPNPFTATIAWKERVIVLDEKLKECSLPQLTFILRHEYAHRYYDAGFHPLDEVIAKKKKNGITQFTADEAKRLKYKEYIEMCCDMKARNDMLIEGFNPSQIGESILFTLPEQNNFGRHKLIVNSFVS